MTSDLKPGYKQSEVGVIPGDWQVLTLGDVVEFLDGKRRPVKDSDRAKMRGDFPYYGASGIVDYVNDYIFDEDLILLGEDGENILSRNCRLAFRVSGKIWVNNHAHVLRPRNGTDIGYLTEYLESLDYIPYNTGTAQPKLNKRVCSGIPVICPPLPEQCAIAAALSDVDDLIASLDKLIAKKRDIKQAAMQQLLTGKRRLPEFERKAGVKQTVVGMVPADWKVKPLGEMFSFKNGLNKGKEYFGHGTPIVNYMDVYARSGFFFDDIRGKVCVSHQEIKNFNVRKGDVFFTRTSETVEEVGMAAVMLDEPNDTVFSGFLLRARPKNEDLDDQFKQYCFSSNEVRQAIVSRSSYTTRALTNGHLLSAVCIPLPPFTEQTAIANVLSDMDTEIVALEARRDKTKLIKQGMMQELLTGRIRLV